MIVVGVFQFEAVTVPALSRRIIEMRMDEPGVIVITRPSSRMNMLERR